MHYCVGTTLFYLSRGMLKARRNRFTNTGVFDRGSVPKYGQYLSAELPRIAISYPHNFQRKCTTPCEGDLLFSFDLAYC